MKLFIPAQNFTRTRIGAVAVAASVAGAMLIGSGPVHATAIAPADSASADSLSITVHPNQLGNQLHSGFIGDLGATTVTLNLGGNFRSGRLTALTTSSSAGLSATTDITLGEQQVGPHGTFLPPRSTPVSVRNQTATVTLPAGSAAIIQLD
jgi:hypothetical protein